MISSISARFSQPASAFALVAGLLLLVSGCKDDDDLAPVTPETPVTTSSLTLEIQHNAPGDTLPLRLNQQYRTAAGADYRINKLAYYVSNIRLQRADGTWWAEPNSYHLVKAVSGTADNPTIVLDAIPLGTFTGVEFGIGVDSAANHHGDQAGALSPNEGMLWNWATGYKFWVMEGQYLPTAPAAAETLLYHIGTDPQYRTVSLTFPTPATVTATIAPEAHLYVDVDRFFTGIDITDASQRNSMVNAAVMPTAANNIQTMFRVEHVHNEEK